MFTLEIAGKPIAVTDAGEERAENFFRSDLFKSHLSSDFSRARMSAGGLRAWAHDFSPRHDGAQREALVGQMFGEVSEVSVGRG